MRDLQGIPKTDHEFKTETCKVWCRLFWTSLLLYVPHLSRYHTGADLIVLLGEDCKEIECDNE